MRSRSIEKKEKKEKKLGCLIYISKIYPVIIKREKKTHYVKF